LREKGAPTEGRPYNQAYVSKTLKIFKWLNRFRQSHSGSLAISDIHESDAEVDPFNPFPDPVEIEISDVIDLHTIPPRDVKLVVEEYLAEAHRKGFRSARIIHGKGIGVQREMVRAILARTSFVLDWSDAPPEAGGLGATIARLTKKG
jgi:dsDNA-specific endonuclease/ATPase MutS2